MTVKNRTQKELFFKFKQTKHGKFTVDPPVKIESEGTWHCSARTGAMIGPKGSVTYEAADKSFTVDFLFNHPYGSATSAYYVKPNPADAIGYDVEGNSEGHGQDITFDLYPA